MNMEKQKNRQAAEEQRPAGAENFDVPLRWDLPPEARQTILGHKLRITTGEIKEVN